MKCLAEKLQLAERKINCVPSVDPKSPPVATQSVVGGLGLLSSPEIQQVPILPSPIHHMQVIYFILANNPS
jgi:hypothetical protein